MRLFLMATAHGMIDGGLTISIISMTCVFVPEDTAFIGLSAVELQAINPRLVPLIAHDRAGFGCAIGVHYPIGYVDWFHLAPAWSGLGLFMLGMGLSRRRC